MERKSKRRQSIYVAPPSSNGTKPKRSKTLSDVSVVEKSSLLHDCLKKAGLSLKDGQVANELSGSKTVFQKELCTILKNHPGDLLQNVDTFIQELTEYLEEPKRFHRSLMPCAPSSDSENSTSVVPDSAVRLLLGVYVIQSPLMVLLLDKLLIFWGEEDDYMFHQGQMVYIPRLLLSQFRFLDRIVDGKELTRKLLTTLSSTSLEVQKEILACIPDIVEDSEHGEVAKKLNEELTSNKDLACAAIDALTYLNISEEQVLQVRTSVVDMLKSFSFSDLPIVVNFLLESLTAQDALEVVNEIRTNIDFVTSSRLSADEKEKVNSSVKLTIDALKGRMQFQRHVADAWIKALDSALNAQMLDVYVLLALHWLNHRKAVESLVRNKIRNGLLTEHSLTKAFSVHTQIVRDYFPSILSLAQILVRSVEPRVCLTGSTLYKLAFTHFDAYCKQEIVASLMTHIGSGLATEIDASLNILADLVKGQLKEMTRFAVFIKGALDYLDHNNLSIVHIRKLYLLLARLAFNVSDDGNYLQDELYIIIRKQLTSGNSKYKRMGVMGAIAIIQALAGKPGKEGAESLAKEKYKQAVDLLELIRSSCGRDAEMSALFLDSLAVTLAMQRLAKNVEAWIADNMTEAFEETFVADLEELPTLQEKSTVSVERQFGLNNEAESTIFISLVPLVEKMLDKTHSASFNATQNPLCLAPLFRLITKCEMLHSNGDLENIDALLGCPILMISPDVYDRVSTMSVKEKDIICTSLFFCINWAREVINSFGSMTSAEMKGKVILRLRLITQLNAQLAKCLAQHSSFSPFPAIFELDKPTPLAKPAPKQSGEKKKGGKGEKGKKRKKGATIDETLVNSTQDGEEGDGTLTQSSLNIDSSSIGKKAGGSSTALDAVDLGSFRQFFRELDISIFSILKVGLTRRFQSSSDTHASTDAPTATDNQHLDLAELKFLLEDLTLKLKHALVSSAAAVRRGGFSKGDDSRNIGFSNLDHHSAGDIVKQTAALFPTLCDLLEDACNFFQTQSSNDDDDEEDDPMEENPVRSEADVTAMSTCLHMLLQCVLSLLCWEGFKSEEHHDLYLSVLTVAVRKLRPDVEDDSAGFVSLQEGLRCTFQYFSNLVETAPDLGTAVTLIKLLKVLADASTDDSVREKLAQHARTILNRHWRDSSGETQKGAQHNENLQLVIRTYITSSPAPLETLESLASENLASMVDLDKRGGQAEDLASLNRWTFPVYYKVMLTELITSIKRIPSGKKSDSLDVLEERLLLWTVAVKILYTAVSLTKVFNARANLGCVLKQGRQFVELFLRLGMPLMDITFRRRHAQVEKLLRLLQQSTRMLHHLCGHSKINKDVALTNQVPMLKRALETFVYRVKAMLALNNCQDAFWMGNLKNRNLQGVEILTQTSVVSSGNTTTAGDDDEDDDDEDDDEDEADNQATGDGEESEVEMEEQQEKEPAKNQEDSNTARGSYSEIF